MTLEALTDAIVRSKLAVQSLHVTKDGDVLHLTLFAPPVELPEMGEADREALDEARAFGHAGS